MGSQCDEASHEHATQCSVCNLCALSQVTAIKWCLPALLPDKTFRCRLPSGEAGMFLAAPGVCHLQSWQMPQTLRYS